MPRVAATGPSAAAGRSGPLVGTHDQRQIRTLGCDDRWMDPSLPTVRLDLWRADAVVLFDGLMSVGLDAVPRASTGGAHAGRPNLGPLHG